MHSNHLAQLKLFFLYEILEILRNVLCYHWCTVYHNPRYLWEPWQLCKWIMKLRQRSFFTSCLKWLEWHHHSPPMAESPMSNTSRNLEQSEWVRQGSYTGHTCLWLAGMSTVYELPMHNYLYKKIPHDGDLAGCSKIRLPLNTVWLAKHTNSTGVKHCCTC